VTVTDGAAPRRRWHEIGWASTAGLAALAAVSGALRLGGRGFSLWVDEGMSVGIASHPLGVIPTVLSQDGSPPLYYLLLNLWMGVFGSSEAAVRSMSLVVATAAVPVAWWAARSLFGSRVGWVAAVLVAFSSYLTLHSREARMYSLVVLLGLVAVSAFLQVFVLRRRRLLALLVASLAALVYTHHWGLFVAVALAAALAVCILAAGGDRRPAMVDAGIVFAGLAVLYGPWVPTLVDQVRETGAPWSRTPGGADALGSIPSVLGGPWVSLVLGLALAVLGVRAVRRARRRRSGGGGAGFLASFCARDEDTMVLALGVILVTTVAVSWLSSQLEPAWSSRYFGAYLPTLVLLAALALERAARAGLVALAVVVALWTVPSFAGWTSPSAPVPKSNVAALARRLEPVVQPGDVVMATQLEQVPLLRHYLGPGLRYADPTGVVADPLVADWRRAMARMAAARPPEVLDPLVDALEPGGHVVLACPRLFTDEDDALWYRLMDRHCESAHAALAATPGVEKLWGPVPPPTLDQVGASMAVTLYRRSGEARP
jgi:mannosyltransferase